MFQVDAFTKTLFSGNPAAVCPLDEWLSVENMQAIAAENNLSETAFFVRNGDSYDLRWFTPTTEVELCGHATLAAAYILWNRLDETSATLSFNTKGGPLTVERQGDLLVMNFPALSVEPSAHPPAELVRGLGQHPQEILTQGEAKGSGFYLAVYRTEKEVRELYPDPRILGTLGNMGVVATAPGEIADFVSRCFAPSFGIDEDPATGSIHSFLTPFWARRLDKLLLHARQVSARGGEFFCELLGDRVSIGGHAASYMEARIEVPDGSVE